MLDKIKKEEFLNQLLKFLRIPSVSGDSKYKKDILQAVKFLKKELLEAGFSRTKIEELYAKNLNNGLNNPVIYAERLNSPDAPTVLIYGHYDVQPPEPLNEWISKPFEPEVRDGKIYGRGATDDKGQLYTHIVALKILNSEWGKVWPVNIKIIIEGEEESGGENIEKLIKENPNKFRADVCLVSDTGFADQNTPAIEVSLRGIAYFDLSVVLTDRDLHSGLFGGAVRNPANVLVQLLGNLQDSQTGKIKIPGIYDGILNVSKKERENLNKVVKEKDFLSNAGVKSSFGEAGFSAVERASIRPSLDINGITGGFSGEGAKTIIPSKASAKFSIRTVPGQDPEKIAKLVIDFIKKKSPEEVKIDIKFITGGGFSTGLNSKYIELAKKSLKKAFGREAVLFRRGGSIPVVSVISKELRAEVVLMGYGLPDDALHSPNEKFDLDQFYRGIECNIEFLNSLAR